VDRQQQRAPAGGRAPQKRHDLARLLEVEAVERLVHDEQRLCADEPEREE
jgi:hypothetical protein